MNLREPSWTFVNLREPSWTFVNLRGPSWTFVNLRDCLKHDVHGWICTLIPPKSGAQYGNYYSGSWLAWSSLNSTRGEKVEINRIEEILVSNSSLVSGLSEASRARYSLVDASTNKCEKGLLKALIRLEMTKWKQILSDFLGDFDQGISCSRSLGQTWD